MGLWRQSFPYHARWMGVNKTARKEEGTSQHSQEDYGIVVYYWTVWVVVCYWMIAA
jgi:hypothetical protein